MLILPFLVIGAAIHTYREGWPASRAEVSEWVSFSLVPVLLFAVVVWTINFVRAPGLLDEEQGDYTRELENRLAGTGLDVVVDLDDATDEFIYLPPGRPQDDAQIVLYVAVTLTNRSDRAVSLMPWVRTRGRAGRYFFAYNFDEAGLMPLARPRLAAFQRLRLPIQIAPNASVRGLLLFWADKSAVDGFVGNDFDRTQRSAGVWLPGPAFPLDRVLRELVLDDRVSDRRFVRQV